VCTLTPPKLTCFRALTLVRISLLREHVFAWVRTPGGTKAERVAKLTIKKPDEGKPYSPVDFGKMMRK
jgi:hypothetical protein